jgi:peptidoglycan/xylan/chitin deacetylase (PgdA/CDA1 family)
MRGFHGIALVVALSASGAGMAGCAWSPVARPQVLAENDDFVIVRAGSQESLENLATRFLGDPAQGWQIAEFNGVDEVRPGTELAIPKRYVNPTGVWSNGYQMVPVLVYHRFRAGSGSRNPMEVSQASFRAQMALLRDEGYRVIPMRDLVEFLAGRRALPKKSVVVTIDDGYRSVYTIAFPVLREFGFPATLFVYTDFVKGGLGLDWAELREMVATGLVEVACHSKTHANLSLRLPGETEREYRARLDEEVRASTRLLRKRLGVRTDIFSFPYGDGNDDVIAVLKAEGYRAAATVTRGGNPAFADPYRLRRTMIYGGDGLSDFRRRLRTFQPMKVRP